MAEGVSEQGQVASASDEHAVEPALAPTVGVSPQRSRRRAGLPHSHKFLAATVALAGIAIGAVAVAIAILLGGGKGGPAAAWSAWKPPDSGIAGEREIADQVAPFYRASPSAQLTVVTVQNISGSSTGTGTQLAVRDPTSGTLSAVPGESAVYNLCGLGQGCAIATGTPSSARLLLLRREALELALYTFKFIGGIDNVVAILPPGRTTTTGELSAKPPAAGQKATSSPIDLAVVFARRSLQQFLERPLRETLPEQLPPTVAQMPAAPEAELVSIVTSQGLFQQQLIQAQDGSSVLVLDPVPPQ